MNYQSTLLCVQDLQASVAFYRDVLSLSVIEDFGANVTLTGGFSLQSLETWKGFIDVLEGDITFRHRAGELYFEEDDIDAFWQRLRAIGGVQLVHGLKEHPWGQRVVRFYDPDGHIIEVGEAMPAVVRRFLASGLTIAQTAKRMDVSEDYVRRMMNVPAQE